MWFRNLIVFELVNTATINIEHWSEQFASHCLQPCSGLQQRSIGWVEPVRDGGFIIASGKQLLLRFAVQEKLLPASVINQLLEERMVQIEEQQGYPVSRRQKKELKEQLTDELLPRAFSRERRHWCWVDLQNNRLIVDSASDKRAEELLELLIETLGDIGLRRLDTELSPATQMTQWLLDDGAGHGFNIETDLELRAADEQKSAVRYLRHALEPAEFTRHIEAGKRAVQLGLSWRDQLALVLTENWQIKRLVRIDDGEESLEGGDETLRLMAEFLLMSRSVAPMIDDLCLLLGGKRRRQEA